MDSPRRTDLLNSNYDNPDDMVVFLDYTIIL